MVKVTSYGDKNYQQKKELYDILFQVFQDWKYGKVHSQGSWNIPVNEIEGTTIRLVGEHLEMTYHHYEVASRDEIQMMNNTKDGQRFIDEMMKALKKEFKKVTEKPLTIKKIKDYQDLDKVSKISAESSWLYSSGNNNRAVGRYLIRDTATYEFSANF